MPAREWPEEQLPAWSPSRPELEGFLAADVAPRESGKDNDSPSQEGE